MQAIKAHAKPGEPMLSEEHLYNELILKLIKVYEKVPLEKIVRPGYISSMVKNIVIDYYRKKNKEWWANFVGLTHALAFESEVTQDPETNVKFTEKEVKAAISRLRSEKQRTCILLYYRDGLKQEQIAEELNITIEAVNSRIERGRQQIKKWLLKR